MTTRLERDFIVADLAKVESIIEELTPSDFLTRMGLESHRDDLRESLASMETSKHPLASAALFFSGDSVVGNRGIDSKFAAGVTGNFQDIVSTVAAARQGTVLGQRGPVTSSERSRLHITHVVHGSFGFQFEELEPPQSHFFDSTLKESVDQTVRIMSHLDEPDDDAFAASIEDMDGRVLASIRDFFELLHSRGAAFRVVSGAADKSYDRPSIETALARVRITSIEEVPAYLSGQLAGVLPVQRTFEYRSYDRGVINGKIDASLREEDVLQLNRKWLDVDSRASVRVRQFMRRGSIYRNAYFLTSISPSAGS